MTVMTPMGSGAKLILDMSDDETPVILHRPDDGSRPEEREVAWKAPDATVEDFRWLASSAAAFHNIPLEERA
jgi:hypothetical protein